MMKLVFQACVFSGIDEVPIPPRAAVITPMRYGRHIAQDRIQCPVRFIEIAKILRPRIDLFLSRRVPGHFAAEWIRLLLPALGALSHGGFQLPGDVSDSLAPEIVEGGHEAVSVPCSEHRGNRCGIPYRHGGMGG